MGVREVQSDRELEQIIELQRANLARNLGAEEIASQGFVTVEHSLEVFVPVNLTVAMTRNPEGEWVAMHAITGDGVGTTRARLFDARGNVGEALQTLFVSRREP
jgi:hypothetical protein